MRQLPSLYAIACTSSINHAELYRRVESILAGGCRLVQLRDKPDQASAQSFEQRLICAREIRRLCSRYDALLIVNDDIDIAQKIDADGVHLGQSDMNANLARTLLGPSKIIGVTCHDSLELAKQAKMAGANYVAFGRFFPSTTKPDAPPCCKDILNQARSLDIPIVAIGGITLSNGAELLNAGADSLAVSRALIQGDARANSAAFISLTNTTH